ncbi:hypothetical protein HanLR1_Chr03g0116111 [Helianthus annuus]|nr:hypothetical protein HanHA89_Chr03g0122821 [Helianthus annuus]KAJ0769749.1 hypothetical protein HanLR1_Chr03g0116111 [Helianthus annuus]
MCCCEPDYKIYWSLCCFTEEMIVIQTNSDINMDGLCNFFFSFGYFLTYFVNYS